MPTTDFSEWEPVESDLSDWEPIDPNEDRKAPLRAQQQALASETPSVPSKIAARAASGLEKGTTMPERVIRGGLDLLGYYKALDAVTGSGTAFQDYNRSWLESFNKRDQQLTKEDEALGAKGFGYDVVEGVARATTELPMQLLGGAAGSTVGAPVTGMALTAGGTSGLSQYAQDRGEGRGQLESAIYGAVSGTITGLTTAAFGTTGVESIFGKEGAKGVAGKILSVLKEAGLEGAEEAVDQFQQDLLERVARNPDKPIEQSVRDVLLAGSVGSLIGGAAKGVSTLAPTPGVTTPVAPPVIDPTQDRAPEINLPLLTAEEVGEVEVLPKLEPLEQTPFDISGYSPEEQEAFYKWQRSVFGDEAIDATPHAALPPSQPTAQDLMAEEAATQPQAVPVEDYNEWEAVETETIQSPAPTINPEKIDSKLIVPTPDLTRSGEKAQGGGVKGQNEPNLETISISPEATPLGQEVVSVKAAAQTPEAGSGIANLAAYHGTDWKMDASGMVTPVGFNKQWTPERKAELLQQFKDAGLSTTTTALSGERMKRGFKVGDNNDGRARLDNAIVQREKAASEAAKQKAADEESAKQKYQLAHSDPEALAWMNKVFGEDFANPYNKLKLSDYLTGKSKKFDGAPSNKWREGAAKLGATKIEEIKAAYEKRQPTPKIEGKSAADVEKLYQEAESVRYSRNAQVRDSTRWKELDEKYQAAYRRWKKTATEREAVAEKSAERREEGQGEVARVGEKVEPKIEGMGGARVKLPGSPQTYTVLETLPQTDVEKENGEQPMRIKNERTGKEEVVLQSEITEVKTPTEGAKPRRTKADLNKALKEAGLDPSVFPDAKSKKNALERAIAKIEEAQKKLRGSRSTLSMGVPKAALDLILEAARLSLKAGNGIAKALEAAIAKARELLGNNFNEDELREQITDELTKTERKETESTYHTGMQESGSRSKQLIEAEQFLEGKTPEEASKQLVLFATTKEGIGLSAENFQAANALLMQRLFEKVQTTKNPVEKAEFTKLIERSFVLMQEQTSEAGRTLESAKVTDDLLPGIRTWLLWRGLAKAAWARAVELKDGVTVDDVKVVEGSGRGATTEVQKDVDSLNADAALMKAIRDSGINLSTLFLDNDQATQAQRRKHLFDQVNAKFPNLSTEQKLKLEKALMEAWEKARLKIFRQQFGKFVGMPEVAQENVIKAIQPELIRQANLGTLDDEAFRAAVAKKLGLPEIDGKTAQDITKLAQEAQKAPEGIIRNKILQKMVDAIQSAGQFDQWQILTDSWFASVLSGTRTMAAVLSGAVLQSGVQAVEQSVDAAIAKASPKVGAQIMFTYLSGLVEGIMNAYDVIVTGDVTRRAEFADNINAVLQGKGRMDSLEGMKKFGNRWQKALAQQAYVRRIIVGFDYVGAIAARDSGILYNAMLTSPEALEIAQRRFNKKLSQQAKIQAQAELGPDAKKVDVLARKLEILNQGIGQEIEQRAKILGEIAALNAPPIGWSGFAYGMIDKLAKVIQGKGQTISEGQSKALALGAKAVAGLAFARAGLNMLGNAVTFVPILGGINVARAYAGAKVKPGQKIWKGLLIYDENGNPASEDRRRLMLANQIIGTTLAIALYAKAAADDDDEDGFEIYGSLKEYTPAERKVLAGLGIQPYTFTFNKKTGRKYSWKDFSFGGAFAVPAEMRDKERRSGELTDFRKTSQVFTSMAGTGAMGLSYVRDLSMIRGFSQAMGISSFSREEDLEGWNRLVAGFARPAAGLVPFSSLMREAETWEIIGGDSQTYRPSAPIDYWLASLPVARRMVGEGPEYNVAGLPIRKQLDAGARFVIPAVEDPLLQSLSQLVVRGIMPKFPYDSGYLKNGEKMTAKELPKLKYRYEVETLKSWREIMLPRAAEIAKMSKAEYEEFYEKELQPESKRIHDEIQLELDPEALTFKGGKWTKNPFYPMKGE